MIYISGMEDGSGDGSAASSKAGWLPRRPGAVRVAQAVLPALPALLRAAMTPPVPVNRPAQTSPAKPRPALGADGRPLPPDGSAPPARPPTGPIPATAPPPAARDAGANTMLTVDGRPVPPVGAPPARPRRAAAAPQRQHAPASSAPIPATSGATGGRGTPAAPGSNERRTPGTPLAPGAAPSAPAGHTFTVRPVPAPAGEFLFDVRCSCGGSRSAAVTLAELKRAAERGLPASEAIAIATQDALDALHLSPVII